MFPMSLVLWSGRSAEMIVKYYALPLSLLRLALDLPLPRGCSSLEAPGVIRRTLQRRYVGVRLHLIRLWQVRFIITVLLLFYLRGEGMKNLMWIIGVVVGWP